MPTFKSGNKICINWKESVGKTIPFYYNGIEGNIEIVEFIKQGKVKTKYNNIIRESKTDSIRGCNLKYIIGEQPYSDFFYNIGDVVGDLKIINREKRQNRKGNQKYYEYKCKKCNNQDWKIEHLLKSGSGCSVCEGYKVLKGYNDIATTDPWMCKYIVNEEDWYKYSHCSEVYTLDKCPYCGEEREYQIKELYGKHKLPCICRDNIKYPEKLFYYFLKQLKIDFIWQYTKKDCNWIKDGKRYDFYFKRNDEEYIIEIHGEQHYINSFKNIGANTLEEVQQNDLNKYELAISNGIKPENYIVIDFRESTLEWGKEHILNSRLAEVLDLSNVDWLECESLALGNLVKEICDYWHEHKEINGENISTVNMSNIFGLTKNTIGKYLKKGTKLNWCNYDPNEELGKNFTRNKNIDK